MKSNKLSSKEKWISSSIVYLVVSRLHKNETIPEHSSFSISSSLKNEVGFLEHNLPFGFPKDSLN